MGYNIFGNPATEFGDHIQVSQGYDVNASNQEKRVTIAFYQSCVVAFNSETDSEGDSYVTVVIKRKAARELSKILTEYLKTFDDE